MHDFEFVIIGAGFAGAATAYHLSRRGSSDILLLEQESIPGFHSSGRNAAMMRQCVPDPDLAELTRDGAAFLRNIPADWSEPVQFKQNGSLLLGSGAGWEKLKHDAEIGRSVGIDVVAWTAEQVKQQVTVLQRRRVRRRDLVRQRRHRRYPCFVVGLSKSGDQQRRASALQSQGARHFAQPMPASK